MEQKSFFVFIVESPSEDDFYQDKSEGSLIKTALSLDSIDSTLRRVTSKATFSRAFYELNEIMGKELRVPVIHISAHGFSAGIALTNGETVEWNELVELLRPINEMVDGALIVCISSCESAAGCQMALMGDDPYWHLVGNTGKPQWSETAIGYATFYHHISRQADIDSAVKAMRIASGNENFIVESAVKTKVKAMVRILPKLNRLKLGRPPSLLK